MSSTRPVRLWPERPQLTLPCSPCRLAIDRTISRIYVMSKTIDVLNDKLRARPRTLEGRPWDAALARSTPPGEGSSSTESEYKRWKFQYESWGGSVSLPTQRSVRHTVSTDP